MTLAPVTSNPATDALARIAADVAVLDDRTFSSGGGLVRRDAGDPVPPERWLRHALHRHLYERYYLGMSSPAPRSRPTGALEDAELGRRLRAANTCTGQLEHGWTVTAIPTCGHIEVAKDGLRLHAARDDLRPSDAAVGTPVAVRLPADRPYASPGFYLTAGSAGAVATAAPIARWYFNICSEGAAALLGAVTTGLDLRGVPFTFKVLNHPAAFGRPDAAVLYVSRAEVGRLAPHLVATRHELAPWFRPEVPLFTRPVAPGLAIADEPAQSGRRLSFGQHRCAVVADALIAAGPATTATRRLEAIVAGFTTAGLDPTAPHLEPGADEFTLEVTPC